MKKSSGGIVLAILAIIFLLKYGIQKYMDGYPSGPTVNITDIYMDIESVTFYRRKPFNEDNLFTGTVNTFNEAGDLKVKAGIEEGKFHGPYTAWHDNGQEMLSLIWKKGTHFKRFKAYYSNGERLEGGNELADKVFTGEIVLE